MAVELKVKLNDKEVINSIKKYSSKLEQSIKQGLLQAGFQLVTIMRELTQKGIDFNRNPFAPYSEQYLKKLNKEGKSTKVDLFYSGQMLGALTPDIRSVKPSGRNKVSVGFSRFDMITRALFNQVLREPNRKFFGFNSRTETIIGKSFNQFIDKKLRGV